MTLLPANIDLAGAEAMLLMRAGPRVCAQARAGQGRATEFDVVIIDCPPSLGVLTLNGLTAADDVIVPLQCETLAHRGVGQFLRTINDVQQITNADLTLLGALPTLYDSRTTHSRDVLLDVADRYDLPVLAPPIPRTVRFAEATRVGRVGAGGPQEQGRECLSRAGGRAAQALEERQGAGDLHARGLAISVRNRANASATSFVAPLLEHRRARHRGHHRGRRSAVVAPGCGGRRCRCPGRTRRSRR